MVVELLVVRSRDSAVLTSRRFIHTGGEALQRPCGFNIRDIAGAAWLPEYGVCILMCVEKPLFIRRRVFSLLNLHRRRHRNKHSHRYLWPEGIGGKRPFHAPPPHLACNLFVQPCEVVDLPDADIDAVLLDVVADLADVPCHELVAIRTRAVFNAHNRHTRIRELHFASHCRPSLVLDVLADQPHVFVRGQV